MPHLIVLCLVIFLSADGATAQPYSSTAWFDGACLLPKQLSSWVLPFTGITLEIDASPAEVLATFPSQWQDRTLLSTAMDVRDPGVILRFENPLLPSTGWPPPPVEFDPPLPWLVPLDSLIVNWSPVPPLGPPSPTAAYTTACAFHLFIGTPEVVEAGGIRQSRRALCIRRRYGGGLGLRVRLGRSPHDGTQDLHASDGRTAHLGEYQGINAVVQ